MDHGCTCFWFSCPTKVAPHTSTPFLHEKLQFLSDFSSPWSQVSMIRRLSPHTISSARSSALCAVNCSTNCTPIEVSTPLLIFHQLFHSICNSYLDCQVHEIWRQLRARPLHRSVRSFLGRLTYGEDLPPMYMALVFNHKSLEESLCYLHVCLHFLLVVYLCYCCCHQTTVSLGSSID